MKSWIKVKLSDLGNVIGGATPSTKNENYYGGDIAWITPKDLSNFEGRFISHGERNITELGLKSCSATLLPKNTVLFTSRAPIGYVAISSNEVATNQGFKSIVPNENTDYLFLYYLLKYNKDKIEGMGSGTTFKEVSGATMKNIEVSVPQDKEEQIRIGKILSSLDDKIELNTRMNKVLEEIARALFRRWFVEFEFPNAEGKPYKTAGGKMVESEMGSVPEGWKVGTVGDIIELSYGKPLKEENRSGNGFPVFGSNGVVGWHNEWMVAGPGIIVGRKGNAGTVTWSHENFYPIDTTFYVVPKMNFGCFHYLYLLLESLKLSHLSADSAVPGLNRNAALAQTILIPDIHTIIDFEIIISSLFSQTRLLKIENMNLIDMRDSLLPKLMNGEIDVSGIPSSLRLKTILSENGVDEFE